MTWAEDLKKGLFLSPEDYQNLINRINTLEAKIAMVLPRPSPSSRWVITSNSFGLKCETCGMSQYVSGLKFSMTKHGLTLESSDSSSLLPNCLVNGHTISVTFKLD